MVEPVASMKYRLTKRKKAAFRFLDNKRVEGSFFSVGKPGGGSYTGRSDRFNTYGGCATKDLCISRGEIKLKKNKNKP
ncbi:MAG TPA: hypothetical protein VMU83_00865 [Hanamia sp.]|nr:hypothetical protein [Hanamia sp.]